MVFLAASIYNKLKNYSKFKRYCMDVITWYAIQVNKVEILKYIEIDSFCLNIVLAFFAFQNYGGLDSSNLSYNCAFQYFLHHFRHQELFKVKGNLDYNLASSFIKVKTLELVRLKLLEFLFFWILCLIFYWLFHFLLNLFIFFLLHLLEILLLLFLILRLIWCIYSLNFSS